MNKVTTKQLLTSEKNNIFSEGLSSSFKASALRLALFLFFQVVFFTSGWSQLAITAANATYSTSATGASYSALGAPGAPVPLPTTTYTYNYGNLSGTANNILTLNSFTAGGIGYGFKTLVGPYVKMRRVDNANVTGVRDLLWYETTNVIPLVGTTLNLNRSYETNMETMFLGTRGLNGGTDNIFCNTGDGNGNNNDIERFDYIIPAGIPIGTPADEGFVVLDRGNAGAHDAFTVAVVTAIDGSGNPTAYSNVLAVGAGSYGATNGLVPTLNVVIMRRDAAEVDQNLKISTTSQQGVAGVFIRYSDLGLATLTTIYGYSIASDDFVGTSAQMVNYANAVYFPTTTPTGGLDLLAISGVVAALPVITAQISVTPQVLCLGAAATPLSLTGYRQHRLPIHHQL